MAVKNRVINGICGLLLLAGLNAHASLAQSELAATAGHWSAYDSRGSWFLIDGRVVLLEGVHLDAEWLPRLGNILAGALWHRALLTASLWLPRRSGMSVALSAGSRLWLAWSAVNTVSGLGRQGLSLLQAYQKATSSRYLRGVYPIEVSHPGLSRRVLLTASLPEDPREPAGVMIDKVPEMSGLSDLMAAFDVPEGWRELLQELSASGLSRLSVYGNEQRLYIRYRAQGRSVESVVYNLPGLPPFNWVLDRIRGRETQDRVLSLLSPDLLKVVSQLLTCVRTVTDTSGQGLRSCRTGWLVAAGETVEFRPYVEPVVTVYPVDDQWVLPVSRCELSHQQQCWQTVLLQQKGGALNPWRRLIVSMQPADFEYRNAALLWAGIENPSVDAIYQQRVPAWLVHLLLDFAGMAGQRMLSQWVGYGARSVADWWQQKPVSSAVESPVMTSASKSHDCLLCCEQVSGSRWVDPGCGSGAHGICKTCFFRILGTKGRTACPECGEWHQSMILPALPSALAPECPFCTHPYDAGAGNLSDFLTPGC